MSKGPEIRQFVISNPTLAAAQILDYRPETLMSLYDSDFFCEVEDDQILKDQRHQIHSTLRNLFNPENEQIKEKIVQAIKTDRLFEIFVFEFFIQECANQLASGVTDLSEETFKEAIKLIRENKDMQKKLEEEVIKTKVSDLSSFILEKNRLQNTPSPNKNITKLEMLIQKVCDTRFSTSQQVLELIELTDELEDSHKPKMN